MGQGGLAGWAMQKRKEVWGLGLLSSFRLKARRLKEISFSDFPGFISNKFFSNANDF
jgi:hypothetical protein